MTPAHGHFAELGKVNPVGFAPRRVRAYIPAGRVVVRPLLVMFDGQNLFDDDRSFAGGWHTQQAIEQFARTHRAPAPIIVGLDHGGVARIAELTPFSDGRRGGGLDAIMGTVIDELLPRVRARFPIGLGPASCFVGGASLGGLAALYLHLVRPDVFGGALAMSPSLWFTRVRFAKFVHAQPRPQRSRIYLDIGAREGEGQTLPIVESFAAKLRARGWGEPAARGELRVMMRPDARGKHNEKAWRRRFPKALRFLLAR